MSFSHNGAARLTLAAGGPEVHQSASIPKIP
jgi:hypothetical protein